MSCIVETSGFCLFIIKSMERWMEDGLNLYLPISITNIAIFPIHASDAIWRLPNPMRLSILASHKPELTNQSHSAQQVIRHFGEM